MKELIYHRSFMASLERHSNKVGFVDGAVSRTYGEHVGRVAQLTNALGKNLGVSRGDRFAVLSLNSLPYLELWHAAFLGGGVINALNLRLAAKELSYILQDSGTKVCFVDGHFAPLVDAVRKETQVENVVLIGDADVPHDLRYEDVVAAGSSAIPEEPDEDDAVVLMYTGGTTGLPKGVLLDQRAEILNMYHVEMAWRFDDSYVYLHQTPMFHAASMGGILGIPAAGGTTTFVPSFEPEAVMASIEKHAVTMTVMVPTMIGIMMGHPNYRAERLSSLVTLTYGASPMPQALLQKVLTDLPNAEIYQGYGMTEASAVLTMLGPEEHRAGGDRLRSAGRALSGVSLSIQDEEGKILGVGATGEVCARTGNLMTEYWNKPEATAEAFRGGWYHSGDAGYIDDAGYLFLVDRVKDMIVTGGENVYSTEVENAISSHPAVAQVAVIGIPDDVWGEAVHAIVVLKPDASATEDEIISHARAEIAGYKVPKSVKFRAEPLPLSGAMKVLKRDLRAPYWEGHGGAVN